MEEIDYTLVAEVSKAFAGIINKKVMVSKTSEAIKYLRTIKQAIVKGCKRSDFFSTFGQILNLVQSTVETWLDCLQPRYVGTYKGTWSPYN